MSRYPVGNRGRNSLLRLARIQRCLTQEEAVNRLAHLAVELGVQADGLDAHMFGRWERGVRMPDHRYQRLLCTFFEMSATELGFDASFRAQPGPALDTMDAMKRRQFVQHTLGVMTAALATAGVGLDPERLARPDFTADMVRDLDVLTQELIANRRFSPLRTTQAIVVQHLGRLQGYLGGTLPSDTRRELTRVTAEAAAFAGRNAHQLNNDGDAIHYNGMAMELAKQLALPALQADILRLRACIYRSPSLGGQGQPAMASRLFDQAIAVGSQAGSDDALWPHLWAYANRAEHQASLGHGLLFERDMDRAEALFTDRGPFNSSRYGAHEALELDAMRGPGLTLTFRPEQAIAVLTEVRDQMEQRQYASWAVTVTADLGAALAAAGEHDEAATELLAAVVRARELGTIHNVGRVASIRAGLPKYPTYRALDDALAN